MRKIVVVFVLLIFLVNAVEVISADARLKILRATKEAIKEQNKDKEHYLRKMQEHNKISEELSNRIREISKTMRKDYSKPKEKYDNRKAEAKARMSRKELDKQIKKAEQQQKTVKDKRQKSLTYFQSSDQRKNQAMNIASSVLKTMQTNIGIGEKGRV